MPRALTKHEKNRQCARLLEKGRDTVLAQGIRKVSVDDITKAAGMAKGTFYQYFVSKEAFLLELIWDIHKRMFAQIEQIVLSLQGDRQEEGGQREGNQRESHQKEAHQREGGSRELQEAVRGFLRGLFQMPEIAFFVTHSHEIDKVMEAASQGSAPSVHHMELEMYEKVLVLAGMDTSRVKPGVVHNYVHALFLLMSSDLMIKEEVPETFEEMMGSLMAYVFEGEEGVL